MARCDICGQKMGFMEGATMEQTVAGVNLVKPIDVCKRCERLLNDIKAGDLNAVGEIHSLIDYNATENVKSFVQMWEGRSKILQQKREELLNEDKKQFETEIGKQSASVAGASTVLLFGVDVAEGYRIARHGGYIFADTKGKISVRDFNENSRVFTQFLKNLREQVLDDLKIQAAGLNCNAVIGIKCDYHCIEPTVLSAERSDNKLFYNVCVYASGNAVFQKKSEEF